jgi:hypothetical protein
MAGFMPEIAGTEAEEESQMLWLMMLCPVTETLPINDVVIGAIRDVGETL